MTTFYKLEDGTKVFKIHTWQKCDNPLCQKEEIGCSFWRKGDRHLCDECRKKGETLETPKEKFFKEKKKMGYLEEDISVLWRDRGKEGKPHPSPNYSPEYLERLRLRAKRAVELHLEGHNKSDSMKMATQEIFHSIKSKEDKK